MSQRFMTPRRENQGAKHRLYIKGGLAVAILAALNPDVTHVVDLMEKPRDSSQSAAVSHNVDLRLRPLQPSRQQEKAGLAQVLETGDFSIHSVLSVMIFSIILSVEAGLVTAAAPHAFL